MIYKIKIALILLLVSCGKQKLYEPYSGEKKLYGPYFWKVQKEEKISYFFGTYHLGVTLEHLQCSNNIKSYLQESDILFTEVADHDSESDEEFDEIVTEYTSRVTLSQKNGEEFQSLDEESQIFFRSRSVPENLSYTGYLIVLQSLCANKSFYQTGAGEVSLDVQLKAISQSKNRTISYLDAKQNSPDVASAYIDLRYRTLFDRANSQLVDESVAQFDSCVLQHVSDIERYKAGNLNIVLVSDSINKALLKDRNDLWFEKFKKAYDDQQYNQIFLAGGVAHFIADFNVLDMLKKSGFSISRMNPDCRFD